MPMTDAVVRKAVTDCGAGALTWSPGWPTRRSPRFESAHGFRFPLDLRPAPPGSPPRVGRISRLAIGRPGPPPALPPRRARPRRVVRRGAQRSLADLLGNTPDGFDSGPKRGRAATDCRTPAGPGCTGTTTFRPGTTGRYCRPGQGDIRLVAPDLDTYLSRFNPTTRRHESGGRAGRGPVLDDSWTPDGFAIPDFAAPRDCDPAVLFAPLRELAAAQGVETQTGPGGNFLRPRVAGDLVQPPGRQRQRWRPRQLSGSFATRRRLLLNGCPRTVHSCRSQHTSRRSCETLLRRWSPSTEWAGASPGCDWTPTFARSFGLLAVVDETCGLDVAWARGRRA